jgi:hypothetical protein
VAAVLRIDRDWSHAVRAIAAQVSQNHQPDGLAGRALAVRLHAGNDSDNDMHVRRAMKGVDGAYSTPDVI